MAHPSRKPADTLLPLLASSLCPLSAHSQATRVVPEPLSLLVPKECVGRALRPPHLLATSPSILPEGPDQKLLSGSASHPSFSGGVRHHSRCEGHSVALLHVSSWQDKGPGPEATPRPSASSLSTCLHSPRGGRTVGQRELSGALTVKPGCEDGVCRLRLSGRVCGMASGFRIQQSIPHPLIGKPTAQFHFRQVPSARFFI